MKIGIDFASLIANLTIGCSARSYFLCGRVQPILYDLMWQHADRLEPAEGALSFAH